MTRRAYALLPPASRATSFSRVRIPKAAEVIADTLRTRIARGELRAGDTLPGEADLMQQFGASRPTLREALRILEAQALIAVARGARDGARVQVPNSRLAARHVALLLQVQGATLADVYEARMLIEPSAARLAAERTAKRAAHALRQIIRDEEAALDDAEAFSRAAIRFQERLVEVSGNRTLGLLTHMLHDLVKAARRYRRPASKPSGICSATMDSCSANANSGAVTIWSVRCSRRRSTVNDWMTRTSLRSCS